MTAAVGAGKAPAAPTGRRAPIAALGVALGVAVAMIGARPAVAARPTLDVAEAALPECRSKADRTIGDADVERRFGPNSAKQIWWQVYAKCTEDANIAAELLMDEEATGKLGPKEMARVALCKTARPSDDRRKLSLVMRMYQCLHGSPPN